MNLLKKIIIGVLCSALLILVSFLFLSRRDAPDTISYGVSFSKLHSDELELPWKDVYGAILDDLGVRRLRLSAHWPMVEPHKDQYHFDELDYQIEEARRRDAKVVLAVGRRVPGWPECHEPGWAKELPWEERKKEILALVEETVKRYKIFENIAYWQVENEPFLSVFAEEHCGGDLDEDFLEEEIALVERLDPTRPILVTDSGNLGLWFPAWRAGDAFGTSVYLYLWNPSLGQVKTVLTPSFYRAKRKLMETFVGDKQSFLIELSLEPWLLTPMISTPLETQIERMSPEMFDEILDFAEKTDFEYQYLWGAEWWYWMKEKGRGEYWEKAKILFSGE